jgi:uncharacterized protein YecT (DUF1311 family)
MKNIEGIQKERIKKAQVAWLKFRDKYCDSESKPYEGGSMETSIHTEYKAKLTE